jgi:hypothetical protein
MYVKNNNILGMNSYVSMVFQIPAQILDSDGAKDIHFSQFHVRKEYSLHPSKLFWMLGLRIIITCVFFRRCFSFSVYHTQPYYTNNAQLTVRYRTL